MKRVQVCSSCEGVGTKKTEKNSLTTSRSTLGLSLIHWINEERPKVMCVFAVPLVGSIYLQALTHCNYTQESSPTRWPGCITVAFYMKLPLIKKLLYLICSTVQCKTYMYANTFESFHFYASPYPSHSKGVKNVISRLLCVYNLTIIYFRSDGDNKPWYIRLFSYGHFY